jgi:CRP/FNR family transcriptional regulator
MDTATAISRSIGLGLSPSEVDLIVRLAETKEFFGGETVVRQFDHNSDLVVVLQGKVKVVTFQGEPIAELGEGSVLGEVSLLDEGPRSATARTVGDTKIAIIPSAKLRELWSDNERIHAVVVTNIAKVLAGRLRVSSIHLDGLMTGR